LADGKGGLIKDASEWPVEPEGFEGIDIITGFWENTSRYRDLNAPAHDGRGHMSDAMIDDLISLLCRTWSR
jgi:hypothetical protein